MELRHVWYFSATLEAGSLVAAAAKLRVAQPALSRQIQDLERELGVKLFDRERTGVRPTTAGIIFAEEARRLTEQVGRAMSAVRRAHAGQLGICRIGVGHIPLFGAFFGNALAKLREQLPDIRIDVREMFGTEIFRAVGAEEIDVGVGVGPDPGQPGIEWEVFYEDPIEYAILPASHPLAGAKTISPKQLYEDDLVLLEPSVVPHVMEPLVEELRRLGFERQHYHQSMTSLYSLVAAGRGWTVGTRSQAPAIQGTTAVRIRGLKHPLVVVLSWCSDERPPVVRNVINALRKFRDGAEKGLKPADHSPAATDLDATIPNALELRHLRTFVTVAEDGSLTRAAPRLGLTQSAVSRQIRTLERITGGPLLVRAARGVTTTGAGEILKREAAAALAVCREATERTRYSARGVRGRCIFGVVPTAMIPALAPTLLHELSTRLPGLEVVVEEMASNLQARALGNGAIDIGIAHDFPGLIDTPGIVSAPMVDDTLEYALVATSHPLASRSSVTLQDLAADPFLFVARSFHAGRYDAVMGGFAALGFHPHVTGTYDGMRTMWALAATGAGWAIGTRNQRDAPPEGLVALKIEGFEIPWGLQILWRSVEPSESVREVIDALQAIVSVSRAST
jgi:DNA-binding transcriptional LysR family regulator